MKEARNGGSEKRRQKESQGNKVAKNWKSGKTK
jgi:hypothetical protein